MFVGKPLKKERHLEVLKSGHLGHREDGWRITLRSILYMGYENGTGSLSFSLAGFGTP
jgi:hypothetical protein